MNGQILISTGGKVTILKSGNKKTKKADKNK